MDLSRLFAKMFGIYLCIVSIAMLMNMPLGSNLMLSLAVNISLLYTIGLVFLFFAIALVLLHNLWDWNWRILITILCWVTLIKSCMLVINPFYASKMMGWVAMNKTYYCAGLGFNLVLGLLLVYLGYRKPTNKKF